MSRRRARGHADCGLPETGAKHMKISLAMLMVVALATASGAQQPSSRAASGDTAFVTKLAQVGIAEVELGKLTLQKTMRDDVKKFAQQMVDDHTKAGDELKAIAMRKNITWPADTDTEHNALHTRLSKLSGAAFDQAYMQAMVDGHRKVATEVRSEATSGTDDEVKEWAAKTAPAVEAHLKHAETVNRSVHPPGSAH
jgi:putative membrane protein